MPDEYLTRDPARTAARPEPLGEPDATETDTPLLSRAFEMTRSKTGTGSTLDSLIPHIG